MKKYAIHPTKTIKGETEPTGSYIEKCEPGETAGQWSVYTIDDEGLEHWTGDFASEQLAGDYVTYLTRQNGKFPNGVTSYLETHYEVVEYVTLELMKEPIKSPVLKEIQQAEGSRGIWAFAERLADEFEQAHAGAQWIHDDWDETLWAFIEERLK